MLRYYSDVNIIVVGKIFHALLISSLEGQSRLGGAVKRQVELNIRQSDCHSGLSSALADTKIPTLLALKRSRWRGLVGKILYYMRQYMHTVNLPTSVYSDTLPTYYVLSVC